MSFQDKLQIFKNKLALRVKSKFFLRNMSFLFVVIFLLLSVLFGLIQLSYKQNTDKQLVYVEKNTLSGIMQSVEREISSAKYQSLLIRQNSLIATALSTPPKKPLLYNQTNRVCEYLSAVLDSNSALESIYLYSSEYSQIITKDGYIQAEKFEDNGWISHLEKTAVCYLRAVNNLYPYVYSVITPMPGNNSYIVFNINMEKISMLKEIKGRKTQSLYICDGETIIFSFDQSDLMTPVSENKNIGTVISDDGVIKKSGGIYTVYTSQASEKSGLTYVLSTPLPEYSRDISNTVLHIVLLLFAVLIISFAIAFYFTTRSYEPIQSIQALLFEQDNRNNNDIDDITNKIINILSKNRELSSKVHEQLDALRRTELLALQAQFNPHFLFNTLNLIYMMEIETLGYEHPSPKLTASLCKILRYSLDTATMVPLRTDLYFTNLYIDILKKRYPGTLEIDVLTDNTILDCAVPALIVQPLLENCMVHGYAHTKDKYRVNVEISCIENNMIKIAVADNGTAIEKDVTERLAKIKTAEYIMESDKKTGLPYIILKLRILFGEHYTFEITRGKNGGNTVLITFPRS